MDVMLSTLFSVGAQILFLAMQLCALLFATLLCGGKKKPKEEPQPLKKIISEIEPKHRSAMLPSEVDVNLDNMPCTPTPAKSREVMIGAMAGNNAAEGPTAANKDADPVNKAAADAKDKSATEKPKDAGKDADVERKNETSQKDGDKDDGKPSKSPKLESTQHSTVQPKKIPSKKGAARRGVTCDEASEPAENKDEPDLEPTQPSD